LWPAWAFEPAGGRGGDHHDGVPIFILTRRDPADPQPARAEPQPARRRQATQAAVVIDVPTLVIHGTAGPMFSLAHGQAVAAEILGAQLLVLEGVGHGVQRAA
jgi:pimeloyl-ACP methyl ester carboxylesterase